MSFQVPSFNFRVPSFNFRVPSFNFRVPSFNFRVPINYQIVEQEYGRGTAEQFKTLKVTQVLDVNRFIAERKFYPDIESIFLYGSGSYIFEHPQLGEVVVNNGSLVRIGGNPVPFGEEYYKRYFGASLITLRQYDKIIQMVNTSGSLIQGHRIISFEDAAKLLSNGQIKRYEIEPELQAWTGNLYGPTKNSLITLVGPNQELFLVTARYDPNSQKIFPPEL